MGIAIVGAGVAGCYSAYRLSRADAGVPVDLFEMSDRIGGRLWSVPLEGVEGSPAEMGGMFFGDMDENVFGLIDKELKLPYAPVQWERKHQFLRGVYLDDQSYGNGATIPFNLAGAEAGKSPAQILLLALSAIVPDFKTLWPLDASRPPRATVTRLQTMVIDGRPLWDWGFWNLVAAKLSNEAYNLLLATMGSMAMFRNANAYDAIWVFLLEIAPDQDYFKLLEGYQSLPETLVARAGPDFTLHMQHRLVRVERKKGRFRLHFEAGEEITKVEADKVILAMPRRALELVDIDEDIIAENPWRDLLDAVIPVPACKLFLAFDKPWWNVSKIGPSVPNALEVSVAYTDLPMRQCYYYGAPEPDEPALLMATYADDEATAFWSGLRHPTYSLPRTTATPARAGLYTSLAMEETARSQLGAMHHDITVPAARDGLFFDWSEDPYGAAWHAWAPYRKSWEVMPQIRQPNRDLDLYVCGEAFAEDQGWVEGAVNSAEMVLEGLGLDRPDWVRADYEFEFNEEMDMPKKNKLSELLVDLSEDLDLQQEYARDPKAVTTRYGLSAAEKEALLSGDEAKILKAIGEKKGGQTVFKVIIWVTPPTK